MIKIRTDEKPSVVFQLQANQEALETWARQENNTYLPPYKKPKVVKSNGWLNFFKSLEVFRP